MRSMRHEMPRPPDRRRQREREGQTQDLPASCNTDDRTTHVATRIKHPHIKYFCRLDTESWHPQEGVADKDVPGTYWITPNSRYGTCYNGCSLWQGGFSFTPLNESK